MKKQILTYALIKSLYDRGEDYLDSFWPFAIKTFHTDARFVNLGYVKKGVKEGFELVIPLHTLRTILKRAKKKGYVEQKERERKYRLTEKGLKYLDTFETDKEVERRLNSLFDDIKQFSSEHVITVSTDQIHDTLLSFIHENIGPLIEYFNPSGNSIQPFTPKKEVTYFEKCLIEYIETAEEQKPEHYKTLQDMVLGSIISTIISSEEPSEMTEIRSRKFKHCQVFLDTNFIFSVLELDPPDITDPAKELFELLKKYGFDLKIFDFTIDEMCRVINGYPGEEYRYSTIVGVDTLYSSLKMKGWTKTDAREFIMNIEDRLSNLGIQLESTDVDLENYNPADNRLRSLIRIYKPNQDLFYQNHDLAAIEKIKELRRQSVRKIEDSKVFFLTSDRGVNRFNFLEMGHKQNGTICEAVSDSLLTNILWLKDPSAEISLKSLIAAYSRNLLVKRRIWERFCEILRELKKTGEVEDEAISTLFYHNYIEDVLSKFDGTEADEITREFILEEIEKASKLQEKEVERKIGEKEEEFLQRIEKEVSEKEEETDKKWLEKVKKIKGKMKESAERFANKRSIVYASLSTLVLLGVLYGLYLIFEILFKESRASDILPWLIPLVMGTGGIGGIWLKLRIYFKSKLSQSIFIKRLKETGLPEIKKET